MKNHIYKIFGDYINITKNINIINNNYYRNLIESNNDKQYNIIKKIVYDYTMNKNTKFVDNLDYDLKITIKQVNDPYIYI